MATPARCVAVIDAATRDDSDPACDDANNSGQCAIENHRSGCLSSGSSPLPLVLTTASENRRY